MDQVLRIKDVIRATGLSRSTLHRLESTGELPSRRRIGRRAIGYLASEILAWAQTRQRVTVRCKAATVKS